MNDPNVLPPHSEAAEAAVLGSMLVAPRAASIAVEVLQAEDFYKPQYQVLFDLLAELHQQQPGLDAVVVRNELERRSLYQRVGGRDALGQILENTPSPANIESYCSIVRDKTTALITRTTRNGLRNGGVDFSSATFSRLEANPISNPG